MSDGTKILATDDDAFMRNLYQAAPGGELLLAENGAMP
jgi:hypothetical protein